MHLRFWTGLAIVALATFVGCSAEGATRIPADQEQVQPPLFKLVELRTGRTVPDIALQVERVSAEVARGCMLQLGYDRPESEFPVPEATTNRPAEIGEIAEGAIRNLWAPSQGVQPVPPLTSDVQRQLAAERCRTEAGQQVGDPIGELIQFLAQQGESISASANADRRTSAKNNELQDCLASVGLRYTTPDDLIGTIMGPVNDAVGEYASGVASYADTVAKLQRLDEQEKATAKLVNPCLDRYYVMDSLIAADAQRAFFDANGQAVEQLLSDTKVRVDALFS